MVGCVLTQGREPKDIYNMHHRPVRTSAIGFNVKGSGRSAFLLNRGKWSPEGCAINCRYMAHVSWWAVS